MALTAKKTVKIRKAAKTPAWQGIIWDGFEGGLADSLWSGGKNSFYKMVGLDIFSQPGSVSAQQKLSQNDGGTVTDLCRAAVAVSDGSQLWFSYSTGKIWRLSAGTWTLVYTTVPTTGNAGCLGAAEFNGNVYWATQNYLHYIATANIGTAASWTANAQANWKLFSGTDSLFHQMAVQNNQLFVGDNYLVASVNSGGTFTAAALTLEKPHRVRCLVAYDIDLIIGSYIDTTVNYCKVYRWDTVQTTWQYSEPVLENGVNSFFWVDKALFAQCGQFGNLYQYTGKFLEFFAKIPGTWNPSNNGQVYPGSSAVWNGRALLGFSADNGDPCDQAVYSFGRYDKKYPLALNEEFVVSTGHLTSVTVGAVLTVGANLYVSWNDTGASSFGVDLIDYSNKYASAFLETMSINKTGLFKENWMRFFANLQSLSANTSVSFSYYANYGSKTATGNAALMDTGDLMQAYADEGVDARVLRMRVDFTVSGNSSPVVEAVGVVPAS